MSKTILSLLAAALVCIAATSAQADQGISSGTLRAMGLSGLSVMSDSDAMAIRGMGYSGGHNSYGGKKGKSRDIRPIAVAAGASFAKVELDGYKEEADAGTINAYLAAGKYEASGANFSEATLSKTTSETVDFSDGTSSSVTKVYTIHVEAGGFSSAKAF
jgi:hypothetical protein